VPTTWRFVILVLPLGDKVTVALADLVESAELVAVTMSVWEAEMEVGAV